MCVDISDIYPFVYVATGFVGWGNDQRDHSGADARRRDPRAIEPLAQRFRPASRDSSRINERVRRRERQRRETFWRRLDRRTSVKGTFVTSNGVRPRSPGMTTMFSVSIVMRMATSMPSMQSTPTSVVSFSGTTVSGRGTAPVMALGSNSIDESSMDQPTRISLATREETIATADTAHQSGDKEFSR